MKLAIIGSCTCPVLDVEAQLKYISDTIVFLRIRSADTIAREFLYRPITEIHVDSSEDAKEWLKENGNILEIDF